MPKIIFQPLMIANPGDAWRKTIASRIPDVEIKKVRKIVYSMVGTEIAKKGARVDCRYYLI